MCHHNLLRDNKPQIWKHIKDPHLCISGVEEKIEKVGKEIRHAVMISPKVYKIKAPPVTQMGRHSQLNLRFMFSKLLTKPFSQISMTAYSSPLATR